MDNLPSAFDPRWSLRALQPTIEHVEDAELGDLAYYTPSSSASSGGHSRNSIIELDDVGAAMNENDPPSPQGNEVLATTHIQLTDNVSSSVPPRLGK